MPSITTEHSSYTITVRGMVGVKQVHYIGKRIHNVLNEHGFYNHRDYTMDVSSHHGTIVVRMQQLGEVVPAACLIKKAVVAPEPPNRKPRSGELPILCLQ